MIKLVFPIFLLVNAIALFCALNPWITDWHGQGVLLFIVEILFLMLVGIPIFLYNYYKQKKTFKQSATNAIDTVIDFLTGWV